MCELESSEIQIIIEHLKKTVNPCTVFLFGSAAIGALRPDSDIDIAFLTDTKISKYDIFMIAQELADQLGREVDLVDLASASTVFKAQIVGKGKIILDTDKYRRQLLEMTVLKEYAFLNEERKDILDKYSLKG
jgi:uncharacterized protein